MLVRVILLFLLFFGAAWVFISTARHITGKQWGKAGKVTIKGAVCAIIAILIFFVIAAVQHASN